jgi:hypothetical protein
MRWNARWRLPIVGVALWRYAPTIWAYRQRKTILTYSRSLRADEISGIRGQTRRGVIEATRQGLPVAVIEELLKSGRLTLAEVDRIVLPRKTLSHRRKIGRLTPEQSDRLSEWFGFLPPPRKLSDRRIRRLVGFGVQRRCWKAKPRSKCSTPPKAQGRWKTDHGLAV